MKERPQRGADLKGVLYGRFLPKPSVQMFSRRRTILRTAAAGPCRSSLAVALLATCVELSPLGSARLHEHWSSASERPSMVLLPKCPPLAPTFSTHRSSARTPSRLHTSPRYPHPPLSWVAWIHVPRDMGQYQRDMWSQRKILEQGRRGVLALVYCEK
jgi:hypothetical protein